MQTVYRQTTVARCSEVCVGGGRGKAISLNPKRSGSITPWHFFSLKKLIKNLKNYFEYFPKRIEYILEWNLLEKSVKRPFCCTVSILQVYFTSFYRKSKINIKRKPNYEIGWFHN